MIFFYLPFTKFKRRMKKNHQNSILKSSLYSLWIFISFSLEKSEVFWFGCACTPAQSHHKNVNTTKCMEIFEPKTLLVWMRSSFGVPFFSLSLSFLFFLFLNKKEEVHSTKECNGLCRNTLCEGSCFILNVAPHKLVWIVIFFSRCSFVQRVKERRFILNCCCIRVVLFSAGQLQRNLHWCFTLHLMRTSIYAVKLMNRFIVFLSLFSSRSSSSIVFLFLYFVLCKKKCLDIEMNMKKKKELKSEDL